MPYHIFFHYPFIVAILREPISLSSVVEPTLFDLWQTISGDWKSVTWRLTALFTFLVLSSGSRLTDYKHQETNWQDNAHHHTTKPSRNNTPLMVLHSSRGQIKKKNYPEYIYISNCRKKVTRWSLIDMWWWNCNTISFYYPLPGKFPVPSCVCFSWDVMKYWALKRDQCLLLIHENYGLDFFSLTIRPPYLVRTEGIL